MTTTPTKIPLDVSRVQRRVLGVLSAAQIVSGVGIAVGLALSSLVVSRLSGSTVVAGFAGTATVLGAALLALPTARASGRGGRRAGLTLAYVSALIGSVIAVAAILLGSWQLLLVGLVLVGGGSAGNLAARYSATDLAPPGHAARHLSWVVWASTVGTVAGPNLVEPAEALTEPLGLSGAAGPFALSALTFAVTALIVNIGLRPDPFILARRIAEPDAGLSGEPHAGPHAVPLPGPRSDRDGDSPTGPEAGPDAGPRAGTGPARSHGAARDTGGRMLRTAWDALRRSPSARRALAGIAISHTAMVSVMSMTPVHLDHQGTSISVIGIVISVHIAGMYVLSPVVGWLADRIGRRNVMLIGMGVLICAAVLAGTAGHHNVTQVGAGLLLLGVGWSCGLVSGSAMLTDAVPIERRPAVQGLSDLLMNVCGATGTILAGAIVGFAGYGLLGGAVAVLVGLFAVWVAVASRRPAPAL
ncbi:MFS transporter [Microtetraspora niveoalba]|uniref:MFS transporter n=1 Tax=Microtetraspora niveoalba TaxID=46175 RepID=UPI00082FD606|nr:MFS transporter [Microtetraspora niveoalba]